jgi:hypothetical protein
VKWEPPDWKVGDEVWSRFFFVAPTVGQASRYKAMLHGKVLRVEPHRFLMRVLYGYEKGGVKWQSRIESYSWNDPALARAYCAEHPPEERGQMTSFPIALMSDPEGK